MNQGEDRGKTNTDKPPAVTVKDTAQKRTESSSDYVNTEVCQSSSDHVSTELCQYSSETENHSKITEITTSYRGFETNEIQYFVCLLVCSKIICKAYMRQNSKLEMAFARHY